VIKKPKGSSGLRPTAPRNNHQKHTPHRHTSKSQLFNTEAYKMTLKLAHTPASYILKKFHYRTESTPGRPPTYHSKTRGDNPRRSMPQHQVTKNQTITSRYPKKQQSATKLLSNNGRKPISSLRLHTDTSYIHYL